MFQNFSFVVMFQAKTTNSPMLENEYTGCTPGISKQASVAGALNRGKS